MGGKLAIFFVFKGLSYSSPYLKRQRLAVVLAQLFVVGMTPWASSEFVVNFCDITESRDVEQYYSKVQLLPPTVGSPTTMGSKRVAGFKFLLCRNPSKKVGPPY